MYLNAASAVTILAPTDRPGDRRCAPDCRFTNSYEAQFVRSSRWSVVAIQTRVCAFGRRALDARRSLRNIRGPPILRQK